MRAHIVQRVALALVACGATAAVLADDSFTDAPPVSPATLDEVRGGFELPANLHASFKLERTALLNGELVAQLSVEIPDIANMTAEQASKLAEASSALVIQNGPDNAFNLAALGPASTVIQNTLSDQHLVALTTISVQVNSLSAYREMNFQDGLTQTLISIPGVR